MSQNFFDPQSWVLMADGSSKKICDIQKHDVIIGFNGKKSIVLDIIESNEEALNIKTRNGESLIVSKGTQLRSLDVAQCRRPGKVVPKANCIWLEAININKGNFLLYPVSKLKGESFSKDMAWLLGAFAAEGSYNKKYGKRQGVLFTLGLLEETFSKNIKNRFSSALPIASVHENFQWSARNISATGLGIVDFFMDNVGEYSYGKCFSDKVSRMSAESQLETLRGWLIGDGGVFEHNQVVGSSASRSLAECVRLMLARTGIPCSLRYCPPAKGDIILKKGKYAGRYGPYKAKHCAWRIEIASGCAKPLFGELFEKRFPNPGKDSYRMRKNDITYLVLSSRNIGQKMLYGLLTNNGCVVNGYAAL